MYHQNKKIKRQRGTDVYIKDSVAYGAHFYEMYIHVFRGCLWEDRVFIGCGTSKALAI